MFLLICVALCPVVLADGLYTYQGSDAPDASSDGRLGDNSFYSNTISNTETGMKIAEADDTVITGETKLARGLYPFLCELVSNAGFFV